AAQVDATVHVLVADVDVVQLVSPGHQVVERQTASPVEREDAVDVGQWPGQPHDDADQVLSGHRKLHEGQGRGVLRHGRHRGHDDVAALADQAGYRPDQVAVQHADGDDGGVGHPG